MMHAPRNWCKKNADNYVEIYIKTDIRKIIKLKKKAIYFKNNQIGTQINSLDNLSRRGTILNLNRLKKKKCNEIMKNLFLNNLFSIGYAKRGKNNVEKSKYHIFVVKAFQRRFRPELINGKIDQECLLISQNLI